MNQNSEAPNVGPAHTRCSTKGLLWQEGRSFWNTGASRGLGDAVCFPLPSNGPFPLSFQGLTSWPGRAACPLRVARLFGHSWVQNGLLVLPSSLSSFQPEHNWGWCSRSGHVCWQSPCLGETALFRQKQILKTAAGFSARVNRE